jgi:hypothetical protein
MFYNFKKKKLVILVLVLGLGLFFAGNLLAQELGFGDVNDIATVAGIKQVDKDLNFLTGTVADVINIVLGLVGLIFVGLMVYSGYQWMTAGGEEEKVTQATSRIKNLAIGLAIILLAFVGTRAVFTFFYNQAGERTDSTLVDPQICSSESDCPFNYVCFNNTCQPAGEASGKRCQYNSDCPADQPICDSFGPYRYCTCEPQNDEPNPCLRQNKVCVDITGLGSACRECVNDDKCKQICTDDHSCGDCSSLNKGECNNHSSKCIWGGIDIGGSTNRCEVLK